MARYFRPSDFDDTGVFPAYVSVTERRAQAAREANARAARGEKLEPVQSTGKHVASTFWGRAWCENLERYSDYANRLPRGRAYLKNGYVVHLGVAPGKVSALVQGSSCYEVTIGVRLLDAKRWAKVVARSAGRIGSLVELLRGRLSGEVMQLVTERDQGLFPSPDEIELECSCPDKATMCKHVAAALYGIGARLDTRPELLFTLRGTDASELVATATLGGEIVRPLRPRSQALAGANLSELFGVPIAEDAGATAKAKKPSRRAKSSRAKARPRRST
ncbi:MAG TPA: SWIM zinc finger family protein [Polyangiaceae bacterium]|nr:SWIM zinc finger family protein [Polyangiaceae bacterium]